MRRSWRWFVLFAAVVAGATAAAAQNRDSNGSTPSLEYKPPRAVIPEPKAPHPLPPKTVFAESFGSFGITTGSFDGPVDVARDALGNFYVLDAGNNRIQKFDKSGNFLATSGTSGSRPGQFNRPSAIALGRLVPTDPKTEVVYVVDSGNDRIQYTTVEDFGTTAGSDQRWKAWGRRGSWKGDFNEPRDITIDPRGFVYVLDKGNDRVQRFFPNGDVEPGYTFELFKGNLIDLVSIAFSDSRLGFIYTLGAGCVVQQFRLGVGGNDGTLALSWPAVAPESGLCVPARIRIDVRNHFVYVLDSGNDLLMLYSEDGMYRWALRGADRPFSKPLGVAVDDEGEEFLIADTENNFVQKFTLR